MNAVATPATSLDTFFDTSLDMSQVTIPAAKPTVCGPIEQTVTLTGETRPWGEFLVLGDTDRYKCKQLRVSPGQRLSLQYHHHREEHWIVTRGQPQITVNDRTWDAQPGEYIFIPKEARHRLTNLTNDWVELVEVQIGDSFEESDIVRLQDDYQR